MQLPNWLPKEYLEYEFEKQDPNYEHFLFCEFLKKQSTPKAKKLLQEIETIDKNSEWIYHQLDLKFKAFLKNF